MNTQKSIAERKAKVTAELSEAAAIVENALDLGDGDLAREGAKGVIEARIALRDIMRIERDKVVYKPRKKKQH